MQERNYNVYLNHTSLLKAILLHSGVPEDKLSQASSILCDAMVSEAAAALIQLRGYTRQRANDLLFTPLPRSLPPE